MKERPSKDTAPTREKQAKDETSEQPTLKAPAVRIGEGAKNLQHRREWFERRTGSDK